MLYETAIRILEELRGGRIALARASTGPCCACTSVELTRARALRLVGRDLERARALAEEALTIDGAEIGDRAAAVIRRWLTSHRR